MKKNGFCFLAAAVLAAGGLLEAKEYDNVLLYKNYGAWKSDAFRKQFSDLTGLLRNRPEADR